jgi:hypothetical protein
LDQRDPLDRKANKEKRDPKDPLDRRVIKVK